MVINTDVSSLANLEMDCECGRTHSVPIRHIHTGAGALGKLDKILSDFISSKAFVIGDNRTMPLAEEPVLAALARAKIESESYTLESERHLILDEKLIGHLLLHLPAECKLIVTIGSGTLNDLTRVISARCGIPYIVVGTAPSMDGYASAVSPIVTDTGKHSVRLTTPWAIIGDTDILISAPGEMLSAGVGDILGKYIALNDWKLAQREIGEYFCPYIAKLVDTAVGRCVEGAAKIPGRDPVVIIDMMDTLILSGASISMHGTSSRPASGCEHQLAHFWEVEMLGLDRESPLHGNLVGLGTQVACRLYELAAEEFDLNFPFRRPLSAEIKAIMDASGDYATIDALGVTRNLFYDSFFHATEANGRYTLITLLTQKGRIEHYAKRLTEEYFGE